MLLLSTPDLRCLTADALVLRAKPESLRQATKDLKPKPRSLSGSTSAKDAYFMLFAVLLDCYACCMCAICNQRACAAMMLVILAWDRLPQGS